MDMLASVIRTNSKSLLVRDFKTNSEVTVFYNDISGFSPGVCIRIKYDGKMTQSKPPEINASLIWEAECP